MHRELDARAPCRAGRGIHHNRISSSGGAGGRASVAAAGTASCLQKHNAQHRNEECREQHPALARNTRTQQACAEDRHPQSIGWAAAEQTGRSCDSRGSGDFKRAALRTMHQVGNRIVRERTAGASERGRKHAGERNRSGEATGIGVYWVLQWRHQSPVGGNAPGNHSGRRRLNDTYREVVHQSSLGRG